MRSRALDTIILTPRKRYLLDLAIRDGAAVIYLFNEIDGNLVNWSAEGSVYDLQVDAAVTRADAGSNDPDQLGYLFAHTPNGSAPLYRHCEGDRPTWNSFGDDFSSEILCKRTVSITNRYFAESRTGSSFSNFTWTIGVNEDVNCAIISGNGNNPNNNISASTGAEATELAHYVQVWKSADRTHTSYRNGTQKTQQTLTNSGAIYETGSVRKIALGGAYQIGTANISGHVDFFAVYPGLAIDPDTINEHYQAAGL